MENTTTIFAIRGDLDGTINELEVNFENLTQYIGLKVMEEEFLFPIASVAEIIMLPKITYVPSCHKYIEGVINLRGTIIPTLNIRKMLGNERAAPTKSTRIIIANHDGFQIGIIVDGITYVTALNENELEINSMNSQSNTGKLITKISKKSDEVKGILDIDKILEEVDYFKTENDDLEESA